MLLSEMLTYTAAEFLDDRADLVDGEADNLWSDAFLCRQFNRATRILTRRAWVLIDTGNPTAGRIVLATGKSTYPLHKSVLYVYDAQPSTQDYPLGRATDSQLKNASNTNDLDAFDVGEAASLAGDALTGTTLSIATDAGTRILRVYPVPTSTENGVVVTLKVARMPVTFLTLDDTDAEPEIDEQWHEDICEYAAGKALTLPTVDSDQKVEGRRLLTEFAETVRLARQERVRAEMGSGRWGFSSTTAACGK
ncbi:MAG: hypothetical protein NUW01_01365 [Gemmatimonadaceae bacterium]|nr:hypothetical protein [Gemmatimonadaceae bacterium]